MTVKWNDWLARIVRQNTEAAGGAAPAEPAEPAPAGDPAPGAAGDPGGEPPAEPTKADGPTGDPAPTSEKPDPFAGLNQETADWLRKKGFDKHEKPLGPISESLRHLEKRLGAGPDRLVVRPDENSPQDVKDAWREAIGVPKDVKEYERVEGIPEDDPTFAGYAEIAHKAGISNAAFKEIVEHTMRQAAENAANEVNVFNDTLDAFQAKSPQQYRQIQEAFEKRGVTAEEVQATMTGDVASKAQALYALMAKVSGGIAEQRNPLPDESADRSMGMTSSQALEKVDRLMNDDQFMKRYRSGDPKVRNKAIQEVLTLREIAARG